MLQKFEQHKLNGKKVSDINFAQKGWGRWAGGVTAIPCQADHLRLTVKMQLSNPLSIGPEPIKNLVKFKLLKKYTKK